MGSLIGILLVVVIAFVIFRAVTPSIFQGIGGLSERGGSDLGVTGPGTFIPGLTEMLEGTQAAARDISRKADLKSLVTSLEIYAIELDGLYPSTDGGLRRIEQTPCPELVLNGLLQSCPTDPSGPPRFYSYRSNGETFELSVVFEDPECTDPKASFDDKGRCIYREGSLASALPGANMAPDQYLPRALYA